MCLVQHKIYVGGRKRGRKVYLLYWRVEVTAVSRENTLLMMETLKSIVSLREASCKWELAKRKREWQRGIMRWSGWRRQLYIVQWEWEKVAEEKKRGRIQKQKPVWLMHYFRLHWYIRGTKKIFCLETRFWPMGGRRPIHPVEPDIHFTHWTKPKSPTVCMECSSSLLQTFKYLEKHVAPCGFVLHNPSTKVCCTFFLLQARSGYKCN